MAHHKRGKPKNARSGCLLCKSHKANGADRRTIQERRELDVHDAVNEYYSDTEFVGWFSYGDPEDSWYWGWINEALGDEYTISHQASDRRWTF